MKWWRLFGIISYCPQVIRCTCYWVLSMLVVLDSAFIQFHSFRLWHISNYDGIILKIWWWHFFFNDGCSCFNLLKDVNLFMTAWIYEGCQWIIVCHFLFLFSFFNFLFLWLLLLFLFIKWKHRRCLLRRRNIIHIAACTWSRKVSVQLALWRH